MFSGWTNAADIQHTFKVLLAIHNIILIIVLFSLFRLALLLCSPFIFIFCSHPISLTRIEMPILSFVVYIPSAVCFFPAMFQSKTGIMNL